MTGTCVAVARVPGSDAAATLLHWYRQQSRHDLGHYFAPTGIAAAPWPTLCTSLS